MKLLYEATDIYQPSFKTGEILQRRIQDDEGRVYEPYIPGDELKEAVNLAIALEQPLLLEGEPGCGKTRLASAIAHEFTKKYLQNETQIDKPSVWWPYYIWNIKSTTRAREGLYTYDAITRLRDAQMTGANLENLKAYLDSEDELEELKQELKRAVLRLKHRKEYRTWGELGKALRPQEGPLQNCRPILLIDEIDKADNDFPNDLLLEIDQFRFEIPETGEKFSEPEQKPIIIITSNQEKPLPEPFLRRCIYFYVDFPNRERLLEILKRRFDLNGKETLVDQAVEKFYEIRELLEEESGSRPPGTSEFLQFVKALTNKPVKEVLEELKDLTKHTSLLGILLKTKKDRDFYLDANKVDLDEDEDD